MVVGYVTSDEVGAVSEATEGRRFRKRNNLWPTGLEVEVLAQLRIVLVGINVHHPAVKELMQAVAQ